MDDDLQILTLPYNNDLYAVYNKSNNIKILILLSLQIVAIIAQWIFSFVIPFEKKKWMLTSLGVDQSKIDLLSSYDLTIYSQILLWIFSLLIRHYLKNIYYRRLRILGYNNHHDKIKKHVLFPSFILHIVNALLLLITVVFQSLDHIDLGNFHFKSIHASEVIITISSASMLINIKIHIYHEIKFRRHRNPPDVFCVDDPSRRLTSDGLNQVAIRSSSFLEDLLENQADLIHNLKLQNTHLRELLYKATTQQQNTANNQEENPINQ